MYLLTKCSTLRTLQKIKAVSTDAHDLYFIEFKQQLIFISLPLLISKGHLILSPQKIHPRGELYLKKPNFLPICKSWCAVRNACHLYGFYTD